MFLGGIAMQHCAEMGEAVCNVNQLTGSYMKKILDLNGLTGYNL